MATEVIQGNEPGTFGLWEKIKMADWKDWAMLIVFSPLFGQFIEYLWPMVQQYANGGGIGLFAYIAFKFFRAWYLKAVNNTKQPPIVEPAK